MALLTTREGASIYYEFHEPADFTGRARTPVIFSCAYCTTHENWRGQVEPLLRAGHPVVLWDLRAHGDSVAPEGDDAWSIDDVVVDLLAVAEATTPDAPFVAAGLSFGGLASLHFMTRHADRVAGLVLIGSGPGFKNPEAAEAWAARTERTASFLEQRGFEDFVRGRAGPTCIGNRPELPAAEAAARAIIAQSVPGIARFGRQITAAAPPVVDELAAMDVPALVIVGEHDKGFLRAGEVMAAKLPRARHVVVPDAGHIVNIDQAEFFIREMLAFLTDLERSPI
ncbi:MAG: alpha/beta fold hydrolase [bacterium]|nr:alpha/beta fold hydrolase [bacterium]